MEYRKITAEERSTASMLQAHAYHFKYNPGDKDDRVETCRAAFDERGHMTACLELYDFQVWFDGQTVGMGGIGGVASLPAYRRGGHVRGMFQNLFEEVYQRGDVLSHLFPFSHPYYRRFGYDQGCMAREVTLPLNDLMPLYRPGRGELFMPGDDLQPLIDIYNTNACRYNLMNDRTPEQWQVRFKDDPYQEMVYTYIWYDEEDRASGYFKYAAGKKAEEPKSIQVWEMAWRDHAGLLGTLGFMSRLSTGDVEKAVVTAGPDFHPEIILPEPYQFNAKLSLMGMSRVINVPRAFECMRKPAGPGRTAIRVMDELAPWCAGTWRVQWDDTGCQVDQTDQSPDLTCAAPALAQLVTGYLPFEYLATRSDVEVTGDYNALERLFPAKKIMVSEFY